MRININKEHPEESKYFCGVCSKAAEHGILPQQQPALSNPDGVLYDDYNRNLDEITKHESTTVHKAIVNRLKKEAEWTSEDLTPILKHRETAQLLITNRVMRTLYTAVKSGVSINQFPAFIDLQRIHREFKLCLPLGTGPKTFCLYGT